MVSFMSEMFQSAIQEAKQLKLKYIILCRNMAQSMYLNTPLNFIYRLCESEIEHSAALSGAVTALRHDEEARLSSKIENMREQEKVLTTFVLAFVSIE